MTHTRKILLFIAFLLAVLSSVVAQDVTTPEPQPQPSETAVPADAAANNPTTTSEKSLSPRLKSVRFIAGLFWASPSGLQRRCAATIITGNTLVTSAVCAKSNYPASKYGQGGWRIVTGAEERYMQTPPNSAQTYVVKNIELDECSNIAIIQIEGSMSFGGQLMPIFISSHPVSQASTMYTFKTSDPSGNSFLGVTQGVSTACDQYLPGYTDNNFMCSQPVLGQTITDDYLGGDPIIGFSTQPDGPLAVLVGITGLYYSTLEDSQNAVANDATAYRFNAIVAAHVKHVATIAGVSAESLVSSGDLG
ncbi:hypothetical protein IW148_003681 [Coemansia sp. RSA 1199]|nr:hypothetical protein IW148_003681 [Coemansia sp. RSA 1199]